MLANTNYAQQERLQLSHMLKPLPASAKSPSESQLPPPPFGPVEDHLALWSAQSRPGVCAGLFLCWRRAGSGGLALVFSSLLIRINQIAFISVKDVEI